MQTVSEGTKMEQQRTHVQHLVEMEEETKVEQTQKGSALPTSGGLGLLPWIQHRFEVCVCWCEKDAFRRNTGCSLDVQMAENKLRSYLHAWLMRSHETPSSRGPNKHWHQQAPEKCSLQQHRLCSFNEDITYQSVNVIKSKVTYLYPTLSQHTLETT